MANSALVCTTYKNVCTDIISSASVATFLTNPQGKNYPLVETRSLRLAVQNVSGKVCKWREFQAMLPNLSHIQGEIAPQLITNRHGVSGLAGAMIHKLILFKHLRITLLISCLKNLIKSLELFKICYTHFFYKNQ